jgi:hypothetical protein
VTDAEWSLVARYLTLMKKDAPPRECPLRDLFSALRYLIRYGTRCRRLIKGYERYAAVPVSTSGLSSDICSSKHSCSRKVHNTLFAPLEMVHPSVGLRTFQMEREMAARRRRCCPILDP